MQYGRSSSRLVQSRTAIISISPKVVSAGLIYGVSALHSARAEDAVNLSKRECDLLLRLRMVLFPSPRCTRRRRFDTWPLS